MRPRLRQLAPTVFALFFLAAVRLPAATSAWLDRVDPLITSQEKKAYLALDADARRKFEDDFWAGKSINAADYFTRLQYVDSTFGSGKIASGAHTDQGRVYLSIGPPTKVVRFPSSRIFVPMEIWYYDVVPGVLNTELRLIFYLKNSVGFPKLYSPGVDTLRALLVPESATVHAFGPNDSLTETDVRNVLRVPPSEDEIISAASSVATGIKYSGNEEILGLIASPQAMLGRAPKTEVRSRLLLAAPKLEWVQSVSEFGAPQVDLRLDTTAKNEINLEVEQGQLSIYQNQLHLKFAAAEPVAYSHRLDLLPGSYRLLITIDGRPSVYPVEVAAKTGMSEILRVSPGDVADRRQTPFEFEGRQLDPDSAGTYAAVLLPAPEKVTWMLRRGSEVVWRGVSDPARTALIALPQTGLPPGTYHLEAITAGDSRTREIVLDKDRDKAPASKLISYNANLAKADRLSFVARQWLLRGRFEEARARLNQAAGAGATEDLQVELARLDALTGQYDQARDRMRVILARQPNHFEALSVLAYVEAGLQDYPAAAELYRRALAVQDSPAVRTALARLPK